MISTTPLPHTLFLCFHCGSPGQPAEWGAEDQEMISIAWTVVDSRLNQVVSSRHMPIRATLTESSIENYARYGFTEEQARAAKPLADILREMHQSVITELLPDASFALTSSSPQSLKRSSSPSSHIDVVPVTAGPGPIRQALHAETAGKEMEVPDYFYRYVDILEEYNQQFDCNLTSIQELAQMLDFKLCELNGSGARESYLISIAVSKLLAEKGLKSLPFVEKQTISKRLETAPCTKEEMVCEETVIKVRGLPWQSSDQDVAQFFRGLDIARGGVALCLNPQGRRNGEALVRFANSTHRDMALMRHKRHMGSRYIEVYKSSAEDFWKIAADPNNEAIGFLSHGDNIIIKMRGLPFTANADDVIEFFGPNLPIVGEKEGILFVKYPDGRSTGDAFVQFETEDLAKEALKLHKANIRDRYIELFRSTAAEVVQVMKKFSNPPLLPNGPPNMGNGAQVGPNLNPSHTLGSINPAMAAVAAANAMNLFPMIGNLLPSTKSCLLLRNLPISVKVEDIISLLGEFAESIRPAGIHMVLNPHGRPSGDCFIQMHSDIRAAAAALGCNGKTLGDHKIQVTQCSPDEMNAFFVEGTIAPPSVPPIFQIPGLFPNLFQSGAHVGANNPLLAQAAALRNNQNCATNVSPHLLQPGGHAAGAAAAAAAAAAAMYIPNAAAAQTYHQLTPPVSPHNSLLYGQPNFTAVKMKGLPTDATVQDVMTFFSDYIIPEHAIQPVINQHGKATGECSVMFWSLEIAKQVVAEKDKSRIRNHVIELSVV